MSIRWPFALVLALAAIAILIATGAPLWVALLVGAAFVLLLQLMLSR